MGRTTRRRRRSTSSPNAGHRRSVASARTSISLERHGFYPKGGGKITVRVEPATLTPASFHERGALEDVQVLSILTDSLPLHIVKRELARAESRLGPEPRPTLTPHHVSADGMGNAMALIATYRHVTHVSTSLGEKGVPAEEVADDLIKDFTRYQAAEAPVGEHLADMLPIAMALAGGGSFVTGALSPHTTTQLTLVPMFLPVTFATRELPGGQVEVTIRG